MLDMIGCSKSNRCLLSKLILLARFYCSSILTPWVFRSKEINWSELSQIQSM